MKKGYIICGLEYGDEGKGKVVDYLTSPARLIVRAQGGNNAGHTVLVRAKNGTYRPLRLHLFPSGVAHKKASAIGASVVADPLSLILEAQHIALHGLNAVENLSIDPCTSLVMFYHRVEDMVNELQKKRNGDEIGTTARGIGPAYADVANRIAIRMHNLIDEASFLKKLRKNLDHKLAIFKAMKVTPDEWDWVFSELHGKELRANKDLLEANMVSEQKLDYRRFAWSIHEKDKEDIGFNTDVVVEAYQRARETILSWNCFRDVSLLVSQVMANDDLVIFEGAQGALLDLYHGTWPYVTASRTIAGGICDGVGIGPMHIGGILGIMKAYMTRVGNGPFPTKLNGDLATFLQGDGSEVDHEFGASTGRLRDVGWADVVFTRKTCILNGVTELAIMKLDRLTGIGALKICTAWMINGQRCEILQGGMDLRNAVPVYEEHEGWTEDIRGITDIKRLPFNARRYILRLHEAIQSHVPFPIGLRLIGTGPGPDEVIDLSAA